MSDSMRNAESAVLGAFAVVTPDECFASLCHLMATHMQLEPSDWRRALEMALQE